MNEYEEAFKGLVMLSFCKQCVKLYKTEECTKNDCYKKVKALQELVKKATPKKAILVHNYDGYVYECPNCHEEFRPNYFANSITWKGCPFCLQALDFSEDTKIL